MRYTVLLTTRAINDLESSRLYLQQFAPETAEQWHRGFLTALCRLETDPEIWPIAPESKELRIELRQFLYRTKSRRANRALFTIVGTEVRILTIRRPGQPLISRADLS